MSDVKQDVVGAPPPAISLRGQYVKDLSIECPGGRHRAMNKDEPFELDTQVGVEVLKLEGNFYEVVVRILLRGMVKGADSFLLDVWYAGCFEVQGLDEAFIKPFLTIEAPRMLYPHATSIAVITAAMSGYAPITFGPVDFASLQQQNLEIGTTPQA